MKRTVLKQSFFSFSIPISIIHEADTRFLRVWHYSWDLMRGPREEDSDNETMYATRRKSRVLCKNSYNKKIWLQTNRQSWQTERLTHSISAKNLARKFVYSGVLDCDLSRNLRQNPENFSAT